LSGPFWQSLIFPKVGNKILREQEGIVPAWLKKYSEKLKEQMVDGLLSVKSGGKVNAVQASIYGVQTRKNRTGTTDSG